MEQENRISRNITVRREDYDYDHYSYDDYDYDHYCYDDYDYDDYQSGSNRALVDNDNIRSNQSHCTQRSRNRKIKEPIRSNSISIDLDHRFNRISSLHLDNPSSTKMLQSKFKDESLPLYESNNQVQSFEEKYKFKQLQNHRHCSSNDKLSPVKSNYKVDSVDISYRSHSRKQMEPFPDRYHYYDDDIDTKYEKFERLYDRSYKYYEDDYEEDKFIAQSRSKKGISRFNYHYDEGEREEKIKESKRSPPVELNKKYFYNDDKLNYQSKSKNKLTELHYDSYSESEVKLKNEHRHHNRRIVDRSYYEDRDEEHLYHQRKKDGNNCRKHYVLERDESFPSKLDEFDYVRSSPSKSGNDFQDHRFIRQCATNDDEDSYHNRLSHSNNHRYDVAQKKIYNDIESEYIPTKTRYRFKKMDYEIDEIDEIDKDIELNSKNRIVNNSPMDKTFDENRYGNNYGKKIYSLEDGSPKAQKLTYSTLPKDNYKMVHCEKDFVKKPMNETTINDNSYNVADSDKILESFSTSSDSSSLSNSNNQLIDKVKENDYKKNSIDPIELDDNNEKVDHHPLIPSSSLKPEVNEDEEKEEIDLYTFDFTQDIPEKMKEKLHSKSYNLMDDPCLFEQRFFESMGQVKRELIQRSSKLNEDGLPYEMENIEIKGPICSVIEMFRSYCKIFYPQHFIKVKQAFNLNHLTPLIKWVVPNIVSNEKLDIFVSAPNETGKTLSYLVSIVHFVYRTRLPSWKRHAKNKLNQQKRSYGKKFTKQHLNNVHTDDDNDNDNEGNANNQQNIKQKCLPRFHREPLVLIIVPNCELAFHVHQMLLRFTEILKEDIEIVSNYFINGQTIIEQKRKLRQGLDILIITPDQLLNSINQCLFNIHQFKWITIDDIDDIFKENHQFNTNDINNLIELLISIHRDAPPPVRKLIQPKPEYKKIEIETITDDDEIPCEIVAIKKKVKKQIVVPKCYSIDEINQVDDPKESKWADFMNTRLLVYSNYVDEKIAHLMKNIMAPDYLYLSMADRIEPYKLNIKQTFLQALDRADKFKKLEKLWNEALLDYNQILIFVDGIEMANELANYFKSRHLNYVCINSSMSTVYRFQQMAQFYKKDVNIMISTITLSRNINIKDLRCVILFDLPATIIDYVGCIVRTGRMGTLGNAYIFIDNESLQLNEKYRIIIGELIETLIDSQQEIPQFLLDIINDE